MADVPDLAALTEAVSAYVNRDKRNAERRRYVDPEVVRAVLEALPREWGLSHGDDRIWWQGVGTPPPIGRLGVDQWWWRAVGPPIPAEEDARA